jgi:hypothetical protein
VGENYARRLLLVHSEGFVLKGPNLFLIAVVDGKEFIKISSYFFNLYIE